MRLRDKVALITGGAGGIGLATAERFAKEGAKIILWDLADKGAEVVERLKQEGREAIFKKVSVTGQDEVLQAVTEARNHFGRIDILINNAGITKDRTLLKMSKQEWDDVIAVNLTGVFNCTQAVAPIMKEQNYGRIVSASSNVAIRGNYGQTNYVATKSAIIGMTKVWAMELGRYGITANCIAPGFIHTAMTDAATLMAGNCWPALWELSLPDGAAGWPALLQRWRTQLSGLAEEFLSGHAAVAPQPKACEFCHLQAFCRIDLAQVPRS